MHHTWQVFSNFLHRCLSIETLFGWGKLIYKQKAHHKVYTQAEFWRRIQFFCSALKTEIFVLCIHWDFQRGWWWRNSVRTPYGNETLFVCSFWLSPAPQVTVSSTDYYDTSHGKPLTSKNAKRPRYRCRLSAAACLVIIIPSHSLPTANLMIVCPSAT